MPLRASSLLLIDLEAELHSVSNTSGYVDLTLRREPLNSPPGGALLRREYALVFRAGLPNETRAF